MPFGAPGRWSKHEHDVFINGLRKHGKEWKVIAALVGTRTVVQIRTHAQKYFQKVAKKQSAAPSPTLDAGEANDNVILGQYSHQPLKVLFELRI